MRTAHTQIVGFGPAAMGVPLAADRQGWLDALLEAGLVLIDRERSEESLGRRRFHFRIESNSVGQEFLQGIARRGAFSAALGCDAGRRIAERANLPVPLLDVGSFLDDLGQRIAATCRPFARSGVILGREIVSVHAGADGLFTTYDVDGSPVCRSSSIVMATGGTERPIDGSELAPYYAQSTPSSELLSGRVEAIRAVMREGRPAVIVGSSHSAFACALFLLREHEPEVSAAGIEIWCREVDLYYTSPAEAEREGYRYSAEAVYPTTSEINRFSGLRGEAKALYRRILAGAEPRMALRRVEPAALARRLHGGYPFVLAAGFSTPPMAMIGPTGAELAIARSGAYVRVDDRCRLIGTAGTPIRGMFGIGLGYARSVGRSVRRVGVNFFHGIDADTILSQLRLQPTIGMRESRIKHVRKFERGRQ